MKKWCLVNVYPLTKWSGHEQDVNIGTGAYRPATQKEQAGSIVLQIHLSMHKYNDFMRPVAFKPMSFIFPFSVSFLSIITVHIVQDYVTESLSLLNSTCKMWTQSQLTPQEFNEHSLLGLCVFQSSCLPCGSFQRWEQLGVAFQDVSQLFLAGAMLIVGVPKLAVHSQEPMKMLPSLLSQPHTR